MTRDEAIAAYSSVNVGYGAYEKTEAEKFIDRLEALGLLKFDDPRIVEGRAREILRSDGYDPNIVSLLDAASLKIVEK